MSKFCKNCGAELPDIAKFCTQCGSGEAWTQSQSDEEAAETVAGAASYAEESYDYNDETYDYDYGYDEPEPKKSRKGLIAAVVVIILLLGAAAIAAFVWPGFLKGGALTGVWRNVRGGFALEFNDGKATVSTDDGNENAVFTYTQDGDKIMLNGDDGEFEYEFKVKGDALTLYYEEDGQKYPEAYTREGKETPDERKVIGRWNVNDDELIIDDDTIIEIHDDEKGKKVDTYTYESEGCTFTITPDDPDEAPFVHIFKVVDDELVISDEDGVTIITLSQDDGGTKFLKMVTRVALAGRWIDEDGAHLSFENGEVITDSSLGKFAYRYALDGNKLTLIDDDGEEVEVLTYTINDGVLTICRTFDDGTEVEFVFTREGTNPPEETDGEIRVVEASHIVEDVPDYPGDPNAKREYSIPELKCAGNNVAAFNKAIREGCQKIIDDVNKPSNSNLTADVEYSYSIDKGVVVIVVSWSVWVAYSDVHLSGKDIYYFDYANDRIINSWKDYLSALGYQADTMEKAVMKTDKLIEFATPDDDYEWKAWDLKLEGIIIKDSVSTVIVGYSYSDMEGSGTSSYETEVPTSQLLKLYNDLKNNKGTTEKKTSSEFSGSDACYLEKVKSFKKDLEEYWEDMGEELTVDATYYCLRDINGDGVNELVLSGDGQSIGALYTRVGQKAIELYLQGRNGGIGVTSDGYIYEQYKYVTMYKLQNGELVEVYGLDLDWDNDDPYEDLEQRDMQERESRNISKSDMVFSFKKYS